MQSKLKAFLLANNRDIIIFLIYALIPCLMYFNIFYSSGFLAPGDGFVSYVPLKKFYAETLQSLQLPLWNSNLALGIPFLADIQTSVFYPPNLIYALFQFNVAYNYSFILCLTLAGSFTYLYLRSIKLSRKAAFVGGLAFMFSAAINGRKGQVTIQDAVIWLPLVLYFYEKLIEKRKKIYLVFMSLAFAIQFFAGFPQVSFYTGLALAVYFIFSIKRYPNIKQWIFDKVNFMFILVGIMSIQLLPTIALTGYVGRQNIPYEFFADFSLPLRSLFTFFYPFFYGIDTPNAPYSLYKNGSLFNDNTGFGVYAGLIPIIFAIAIIVTKIRTNKFVFVWTIIMSISIVLALGDAFPLINKIMYKVPIYNAFRVSSRINFVFDFAISVLFALQVHRILEKQNRILQLRKHVSFISTVVVLTAVIIAAFLIISPPQGLHRDTVINNFSILNPSIYIPTLLLILYNIILFSYTKFKWNVVLQVLFTIILLIDLHSYSFYYANIFQSNKNEIVASEIKQLIEPNERAWAVFDNYSTNGDFAGMLPNRSMYYGINSINGYTTFISDDYKSLLGFDERGINIDSLSLITNNYVLSSLNTKYIIANNYKKEIIEDLSFYNMDEPIHVASFNDIQVDYDETAKYGLHQNDININANSLYKITVTLKNPAESNIYVDFYGEDYDSNDQQFSISNSEEKTNTKIFNSGLKTPEKVYLRIISLSKEPVIVEKLTVEILPKMDSGQPLYKEIYKDDNYSIYENNYMLNKFYGVQNVINSKNIKSDLYATNLLTTALVVDSKEMLDMKLPSINMLDYRDGYGKAEVFSDESSFIVFSEQHYPGWKAFIDGNQTEILKVNGLIQGIEVPEGKHIIEFSYKPKEVQISFFILLFTIFYIIVYLNLDKIRCYIKKRRGNIGEL